MIPCKPGPATTTGQRPKGPFPTAIDPHGYRPGERTGSNPGTVPQVDSTAADQALSLGAQEGPPGGIHGTGSRPAAASSQDPQHGCLADMVSEAGKFGVHPAVPQGGFSRASRSTRSWISRLIRGRPG